ncbi:MAG: zinc ribbon domain-containing protein [Acidobacteria bacterium]|nr:zinc ribbon domain-containing protein [Acidobacteriota bacterium]
MFCPKCASAAVPGQRFCRACGANLGAILDAMEGKRGPLDFETLKRDLRELGANLRTGFEEASQAIKRTSRLDNAAPPAPAPILQPILANDWQREVQKAVRKVKAANTRKYSLQQATLSLFGGGVWIAVWYQLLNAAADSGLLRSLELIILQKTEAPVVGLVPVMQLLWMLGLIPMARGVAHLFNGIFFAPKPEPEPEPPVVQAPVYGYAASYPTPVSAVPPMGQAGSQIAGHVAGTTTNDLQQPVSGVAQPSVTEDATLRFEGSAQYRER